LVLGLDASIQKSLYVRCNAKNIVTFLGLGRNCCQNVSIKYIEIIS